MDGAVDIVSEVINLLLAVQVSSHDVVGLHECIKLALEVLVLLSEQRGVLLKGLVLGLEVHVPVHQCLVGVVNGLQVGVLAPLLNLEGVELGLETLKLRSQLVSAVVLIAVLLELDLLLLDEGGI